MIRELQTVLDTVRSAAPERLCELIGDLEAVKAAAWARLASPAATSAPQHDELLTVEAAAERLSMSTDYLYRNADSLPFTRRMGRKLRFSSIGIDRYIAQKRG